MTDNQKQTQKAEENAIAVMAGNDVNIHHHGMTYADARDIARDVYRADFAHLTAHAVETAKARTEKIIDDFLRKLEAQNPAGVQQASDPDFQIALYGIQRDYARTGDDDLGTLLVDLLVDRSKAVTRDLRQIVLNESLETARKLTREQVASLSLIFLLRYTQSLQVVSIDTFGQYLDALIQPLSDGFKTSQASVQHMEFSGCGAISAFSFLIEQSFLEHYRALFSHGIDGDEALRISGNPDYRSFLMKSLRDPSKLQLNTLNQGVFDELAPSKKLTPTEIGFLKSLGSQNLFSHAEVRTEVVKLRPFMEQVFAAWDSTPLPNFTLTSVGIAIGHANLKRFVPDFGDLSIWIN